MDPTKVAIRATTQDHLDIADIQDDLVILKDGGACLVIATTAINFGLLSEKEQEATIYAYSGLLNSLTFSIQIIVRSQRKDISSYLRLLEEAENKETRPKIKEQIRKYHAFISETVRKNEVLDKKFYLVLQMSSLELGVGQTLKTTFGPRKKTSLDIPYIVQKAKLNLNPKKDHLLRLLARLGLKGRQLNTQELIQLFFNIYNPEVQGQTIAPTQEYATPMVQTTFSPKPAANQNEPAASRSSIQDQINQLVKATA